MQITARGHATLKQIVAQTANSFQAQICAISLSSDGGASQTLAYGGDNPSTWTNQQIFAEFFRDVTADGKPVFFSSAAQNGVDLKLASLSPFLSAQGIQALVAIPMQFQGAPCGALSLFFDKPRHFSQNEIQRLTAVAKDAILALHRGDDNKPPDDVGDQVFENMMAQSAAMFEVFDVMRRAAATDANVLIIGESGTGKELIAKGIHNLSRRKNKPFIPVDCVALPSNLIESELFGFEKGAFTGAVARKHGLLEIAHGGSFFFDEISELDLMLQAKLLRVLQERQFRRIGSQDLISVDIRVISATNRNPELAVKDKVLRHDLYFRLNVIPIFVPTLRERKEDIPLLANVCLNKFIAANDLEPKTLDEETIQALQSYHWPGNVRELQNVIERVASLCASSIILPKDLPDPIRKSYSPEAVLTKNGHSSLRRWREEHEAFKLVYFKSLLEQMNGDIYKTANHAGVSWRTVYRVLNRNKLI